jgi:heptosyltransferase I
VTITRIDSEPQTRARPPGSICILRLSALGDVTHVLPVIHRLRRGWPETRLTWIVGRFEHQMVRDLPEVEFIPFDKSSGWKGMTEVWTALRKRRFHALLHMQVALRANLVSALVRAPLRIGYDRSRSKDLHGVFVNRRIPPHPGQHVVEVFQSFLDELGVPGVELDWSIPVPEESREWAVERIGSRPAILISPCSSHPLRNWRPEFYAEIADYAAKRYGLQPVLCGGPGPAERDMGRAILERMRTPALDLIGKDTIKRMLALLSRARLLVSPDSGPAHMATCVGTPVIGLYAASNSRRSGPFLSRQWCVDEYDAAARKYLGRPASEIPWGTKIEKPGVMDLVKPASVKAMLDRLAEAENW